MTAPAGAEVPTPAAMPDDLRVGRDEVSGWRREWSNFSWLEGALTATAVGATAGLFSTGPATEPRWRGGVLFDNAVRRELRGNSESVRARFRSIGDATYFAAPALALADVLVLPLAVHGDSLRARNMTLVAVEAFSYSGLASFVTTQSSARERPDSSECEGRTCRRDTESFVSGHSMIAATGAGLICAHHVYLPHAGYEVFDVAACAVASTNALLTATTRVVADRHYATDVLAGVGLGFAFGYAVPALIHFKRKAARMAVDLDVNGDRAMLRLNWQL